MSAGVKAIQGQLREIVRDLETIGFRLIGAEAALPPSPAETDRLQDAGTEDTDLVTELRSAIQCIHRDSLQPLIEGLREASELASPEAAEGEG